MEWQPVSTASLIDDGSEILAYAPVIGRCVVVWYAGFMEDGAPMWSDGDVTFPISHWMPLPPSPTAPEPEASP